MPVGRTSPSTRLGGQFKRPADVPLGDSDRDVAQPRSGWLSSRSPTTASSRLHCRPTVPVPVLSRRTDRQSLQLLPTPATSTSADVHWLPVSSGGPMQHPAFPRQQRTGTAVSSRQRLQHSRCEAPLRQPKSLGLSALTLSAHCRALSQLSFSQLGFSHSYRTLQNTCVLQHGLTLICLLSRNFFASPLKHVLLTCLTVT